MNNGSGDILQQDRDEALEHLEQDFKLAFKKRGSDPHFSFDLVRSIYNRAVELQLSQMELKALHAICSISHHHQTNTDPYKWIDVLIQRGIELNDNLAIGRAYIHRYRWSRKSGNYSEGVQYLQKALEFLDPKLHSLDISGCYTGLGNIYFELKEYDRALKYYHQGLELKKDKPAEFSLNLKQNIASVYLIQKDYAKAWERYQDLLPILPPSEVSTRTLVLQNLGHICNETRQSAEAEVYFQEALDLKLEHGLDIEIIRTFCNLMNVQIILEKTEKVSDNIKKAEKFIQQDQLTEQIELLQINIKYCQMINDLPRQIDYYEKLVAAKDKLNQEKELEQVIKFEDKHQINHYKEKYQLLESRNKLIDEQNKYLQESMQKLLNKEKELEIELKNAFRTIDKKDDLLAAHHRLASVGEMIAIIAHQWKQPLSIINSLVFGIKDAYHYNELTEDFINEKAKMIDDLIQYLSQTMNDFRNFFKEQNNMDFKASDAVKGAISLLSYALDKENVSVIYDFDKDFSVHGAQNELIQVFLNLINNARDAFKEEKKPQPIINIFLDITSNHNIISLYNNGGPILEELNKKIFEAYVSSKGEKGTGLGLNICQTIIEDRFKGKIYFQNTQDGVTFYIELPLIKTENTCNTGEVI